ncbi:disease resistance RPP8-like protein 3 [Salvia miltiorrhiza]|uniref:disease resistance RPP8-like protein 3 n=1 Tax=Salvia miltiorrhiza TaxID=226208 RepID=UPI0025ABA217|nr:disease resistance RPP8-like protein 3 [Salvia miltiorrhiza]
MAEAMILSAVEKLETLLVKEGASIVGGGEHVRGLQDDLRGMLPLLTDDSSTKELAHEADLAIDTFISSREDKRIRPRRSRIEFLTRIDGIRSSLRNLKNDSRSSSPAEAAMRSSGLQPPPRRNILESQVVGMKEDVESLLQEAIFFDEAAAARWLSASCIVGMGGVGKTTLAQILYNHERVASEFELRAWVCVSSESLSAEEVLKELILQLGIEYDQPETKMVEADDRRRLRDMVFLHLRSRRYFIVLDHVWRDGDLEFVLTAFPDNEKASRLLLTSRIRNIIAHAHYIHERKILDPNESWRLFLKTVFGEYTKCPSHLKEIGRKIVAKCDGLPLAIIEAGDMLSEKEQSESEWEIFLASMDLSSTSAVLELSYHKLQSPTIGSCFLYLGSFMEAKTMRVEKMVQVWTARGEERNETDEEIGTKYIDELINQSMLEVKERSDKDNRVKYCYINYNLHMLAVAKAKEEIRFEIRGKINDDRSSVTVKSRHCVMYCSRDEFDYYSNHDKHLVSLIFRGGGSFDATSRYWMSFKLLKILDFEGFGLKSLPDMIGKLISLKYLGLRNNFIKQLPRSLGLLEKLEVLDIALNFMVEVPNIIREMRSLCHLYMSDIICLLPLCVDALKNLQTLTYISVDNWEFLGSAFNLMHDLRKLGIQEMDRASSVRKLFATLAHLKNLDCLFLRGSPYRGMLSLNKLCILKRLTRLKLDGLLTELPSAINFPPNIRYLTLVDTCLDEDPMPVLEKLPKLVFLKLRNAFTGEKMTVSRFRFAELEGLCIGELWNLRNLQVGEGALLKLKLLEIKSCPNLETLPEEIRLRANNLKELKMVTTKGIARKILDGGLGSISRRRHVDIKP